MPAEAGLQAVGDDNNFEDLDSRFRGNDILFFVMTQSFGGEGGVRGPVAGIFIFFKSDPKPSRLTFLWMANLRNPFSLAAGMPFYYNECRLEVGKNVLSRAFF
jgi:hypothetical protein